MENFKIFDSELEKLTHRIIQMCMQVSDQLKNVVIALETLDLSMAKKIIENDKAINDLDVKIDKMCHYSLKE